MAASGSAGTVGSSTAAAVSATLSRSTARPSAASSAAVTMPSLFSSKYWKACCTRSVSMCTAALALPPPPRSRLDGRKPGGRHSIAQTMFLSRRCDLNDQAERKWLLLIHRRAGHLSGRVLPPKRYTVKRSSG